MATSTNLQSLPRASSSKKDDVPAVPVRKDTYTTWLWLAFAVIVAAGTAFGFWYAGTGL